AVDLRLDRDLLPRRDGAEPVEPDRDIALFDGGHDHRDDLSPHAAATPAAALAPALGRRRGPALLPGRCRRRGLPLPAGARATAADGADDEHRPYQGNEGKT